MSKNLRSILSVVLCLVLVATAFVGCVKDEGVKEADLKQAEYNTTTSVMPSNWNEFTYADNNDTQIMSYIGSSFFEYDYKFENDEKFNKDGTINKDAIVPGAYTTNYSAATKLEDITATVDAKWGYTDAQKAEGGYAWKITLRDDLKWDDGTAITAADFVYSMQQLLDPAFMNFRANTYYDTLMIKNSKAYFFQNQEGTYETIGGRGYASVQAAIDAGETLYANAWNMWGAAGYTDENGIAKFTLRYGKYTYTEFECLDGYYANTEEYPFEIKEDGQIIKAAMTNEKIPVPEIPQTGDNSNIGFWIGLAAVALGGLVATVIIGIKRKKDDEED